MQALGFTYLRPGDDLHVPIADVTALGVAPSSIFLAVRLAGDSIVQGENGDLIPCGIAYSAMQITNPTTAEEFLKAATAFVSANPPPDEAAVH